MLSQRLQLPASVSRPRRVERTRLLLVTCVLVCASSALHADEFVLQNGGRIRGEWINREQQPLLVYDIRTPHGTLRLSKDRVERVTEESAAAAEYRQRAPNTPLTAPAQWELARWCRQEQLVAEEDFHLLQVLRLDSDHVDARHALGYSQVGDRWVRRREYLREKGYQLYQGRWRLPQEIKLLEQTARQRQAEAKWMMQIKRLRGQLGSERGREAAARIAAIRDPYAVKALLHYLNLDHHRGINLLYVEALGKIPGAGAGEALITTSLNDPDIEVFHACVDKVVERRLPYAVAAYTKGLQDAHNGRVNRAAHALGRLGDTEALGPLIDALQTRHRVVVGPQGAGPDSITSTFAVPTQMGPSGTPAAQQPITGTGLSTGNKQQVIERRVANQEVLDALIKLSGGVSFGFDQRGWQNWHLTYKTGKQVPLRGRRTD